MFSQGMYGKLETDTKGKKAAKERFMSKVVGQTIAQYQLIELVSDR